MRSLLILFIRSYRYFLSPLLGSHCRFEPSCSVYAMQAIQQFGIFRGSWFAVCRILRCHPLHPGGFDPVPDVKHRHG